MKENNPQDILKDILLKMNYDLSKTLSEQSIKVPDRQGMPSDYLGSGGRFQLQFPEYDLKQQEKISNTVRVTPSEYTKKLTNEQYQEFLKERNRIVIQDNGRGMTQKEFEKLSEPYTRKENQKESGSGLGLNICIAILTEHGFTVSCEKNEIGTKMKIKIK